MQMAFLPGAGIEIFLFAFYQKIPQYYIQFWIIFVDAFVMSAIAITNLPLYNEFIDVLFMATVVEICRVILAAIIKKRKGLHDNKSLAILIKVLSKLHHALHCFSRGYNHC